MSTTRFCILVGGGRTNGNSKGMSKWVKSQLDDLLNSSTSNVSSSTVIIDPHTKPHPVTPVIDEKLPAMVQDTSGYASEEVREWSTFIKSCNAVVIVSPEYNFGYPSTLKNAIDVLYSEWTQKPVALVTFGSKGGQNCHEQLRQVMTILKMDIVEQKVQVSVPGSYLGGNQRVGPSSEDNFLTDFEEPLRLALKQLVDKVQK